MKLINDDEFRFEIIKLLAVHAEETGFYVQYPENLVDELIRLIERYTVDISLTPKT